MATIRKCDRENCDKTCGDGSVNIIKKGAPLDICIDLCADCAKDFDIFMKNIKVEEIEPDNCNCSMCRYRIANPLNNVVNYCSAYHQTVDSDHPVCFFFKPKNNKKDIH